MLEHEVRHDVCPEPRQTGDGDAPVVRLTGMRRCRTSARPGPVPPAPRSSRRSTPRPREQHATTVDGIVPSRAGRAGRRCARRAGWRLVGSGRGLRASRRSIVGTVTETNVAVGLGTKIRNAVTRSRVGQGGVLPGGRARGGRPRPRDRAAGGRGGRRGRARRQRRRGPPMSPEPGWRRYSSSRCPRRRTRSRTARYSPSRSISTGSAPSASGVECDRPPGEPALGGRPARPPAVRPSPVVGRPRRRCRAVPTPARSPRRRQRPRPSMPSRSRGRTGGGRPPRAQGPSVAPTSSNARTSTRTRATSPRLATTRSGVGRMPSSRHAGRSWHCRGEAVVQGAMNPVIRWRRRAVSRRSGPVRRRRVGRTGRSRAIRDATPARRR